MDETGDVEAVDDQSGQTGGEVAGDSFPPQDTPEDAASEYGEQWYGTYTAAAPGSLSSVTGEVLDAWFGADAAIDPEGSKSPWDESPDDYAAADEEIPPWDEAESSTYA